MEAKVREKPQASLLPDGKRLHLHHGPIDLIIGADAAPAQVGAAYNAAEHRFQTILDELYVELPLLRTEVPPSGLGLKGGIARTMERAVLPYWHLHITPMAAVAGAVAEHVLASMLEAAELERAYVNNGGDIAFHLGEKTQFVAAAPSGDITVKQTDKARGMATSGWRGRSHSFGIADAVTVIAERASDADAAATMIANAVTFSDSGKIARQPACELSPDSDLRDRLVTVGVAELTEEEVLTALLAGVEQTQTLMKLKRFEAATLMLAGQVITVSRIQEKPWEEEDYEQHQIAPIRYWDRGYLA
jgi:uncharacterized protein